MPAAIVDTSPLQYLYQLDLLHLLPDILGTVIIPQAVAVELAEGRRLGVALPDPELLPWLNVQNVSGAPILPPAWDLGCGEREVLALALEQIGTSVVLDDRLARQAARTLGIPLTGTLGILLRAKQLGKIEAIKPHLDRLDSLNFRVDAETRASVLRLSNENP